jgi:hypothetical protein
MNAHAPIPPNVIVTDDQVSAALDYLAKNDQVAAGAAGMYRRSEHKRKAVRARLIRECNAGSADMRVAFAESHPDYVEACEDEAEAYESVEYHRNRRNTCDTIVEAWRTQCSNQRAGASFR